VVQYQLVLHNLIGEANKRDLGRIQAMGAFADMLCVLAW
jgi:hypothetical protein